MAELKIYKQMTCSEAARVITDFPYDFNSFTDDELEELTKAINLSVASLNEEHWKVVASILYSYKKGKTSAADAINTVKISYLKWKNEIHVASLEQELLPTDGELIHAHKARVRDTFYKVINKCKNTSSDSEFEKYVSAINIAISSFSELYWTRIVWSLGCYDRKSSYYSDTNTIKEIYKACEQYKVAIISAGGIVQW